MRWLLRTSLPHCRYSAVAAFLVTFLLVIFQGTYVAPQHLREQFPLCGLPSISLTTSSYICPIRMKFQCPCCRSPWSCPCSGGEWRWPHFWVGIHSWSCWLLGGWGFNQVYAKQQRGTEQLFGISHIWLRVAQLAWSWHRGWFPQSHGFRNKSSQNAINLEQFHSFQDPCVWHWVVSFLIINPGRARICFSGFAVSGDCFVNQQLGFRSSGTFTKAFLCLWHLLT